MEWDRTVLAFADTEYLCSAIRATALSCRPFILERDCLGILDFYFFPAFHAICLHRHTSLILAQQSNKTTCICQ